MNIPVNENTRNSLDLNLFNDLNTTMLINEHIEEKQENIDNINKLRSMGFDIKMVKKVYVLLKPRNLDEAIYLLTQDKGKYHHYFVQRIGKENECFICGLNPQSHINFLPKKNNQRNSVNKKIKDKDYNKINKEMEGLVEPLINDDDKGNESLVSNKKSCDVCEEEISLKEIKENILPCGHLFCTDCYAQYFKQKIENNDVSSITCMQNGCTQEIDSNFIQSHLNGNKELFEKYLKFKKRNDIYKNPNLVPCPIEDCESFAKKEGNNKFVKCENGHKFCSECKTKWHKGKDCDTEAMVNLIENYHLKKCPKCNAMTEKNFGCNHMKCQCGTHWCWFCRKPFKSEKQHYGVNGPCSNLHYTSKEMYNNCCILFIHNSWIEVMHNFLLLFIITSISAAFFLRKAKRDMQDETFIKFYKIMRIFSIVYSISFLGLFLGIGIPTFLFCNIICPIKRKIIRYILDLDDNELDDNNENEENQEDQENQEIND